MASFLPMIDYGDVLYMHAPVASDTVYHGALHFILNPKSLTHHCLLSEGSGLT